MTDSIKQKKILITGGSKGLGSNLAKQLRDTTDNEIITIARTGDVTYKCDINDRKFMSDIIINNKPNIIINNAALRNGSPYDMMKTNAISPIEIILDGINIGTELIINIGSDIRFSNGYLGLTIDDALYATSKVALADFSNRIARSGIKTRIVNIDPGWIATEGMGRIKDPAYFDNQYERQTLQKIPIRISDVIDMIITVINMPKYLNTSISMFNNQKQI